MIIVIPCYCEPDALKTVESLYKCERGNFQTEVIVVVNSYRTDSEETVELNRRSFNEIFGIAKKCNTENFSVSPMLVENIAGHQTGAGIPRKIGMDSAVNHFGGDPKGIIVSLDADCTVEPNYLVEIEKNFRDCRLNSATIAFHHPVEHLPAENPLRIATENYEAYMRDFRAALEYCGYPYPYYTIGSAFAVTAETYRKVGGMGRQQAGEDFYFLQKVFPLGSTKYIDTTCVYPEARVSDRVPFGTGPALKRALETGCLTQKKINREAFEALKMLFDRVGELRVDRGVARNVSAQTDNISSITDSITCGNTISGVALQKFLEEDGFTAKIAEINRYTASLPAFRKRFFDYFNTFKIIKYLNFCSFTPQTPAEQIGKSPIRNK
jgi:hypothetical protein